MLQYSLLLTILGIVVLAINAYVMVDERELRNNLSRGLEQSMGRSYGITMSCIDNMESIKAAGAERGFFAFCAGNVARVYNHVVIMRKRKFYP